MVVHTSLQYFTWMYRIDVQAAWCHLAEAVNVINVNNHGDAW
jgi:hypothetical protein